MSDIAIRLHEDDFLVFRGDSDQEAESFIRAVNVQAFKQGKSKDKDWITTYASAAFSGKALRWYRRLPATTRTDWEALQEAILDNEWGEESSSVAPTPASPPSAAAAAAPPPPTVASPPGPVTQFSRMMLSSYPVATPKKTGLVRVSIEERPALQYLGFSRTRAALRATDRQSDAITIEWDPSSFPCKLRIVGEQSPYCYIGAQYDSEDHHSARLGDGKGRYLFLTPVTDPANGCVAKTGTTAIKNPSRGPALAALWSVLQDGSLIATVKQDEATFVLGVVVQDNGNASLSAEPSATANADQRTIEELENKLDLDRYTNAPDNAHKTDDSKDSQNLKDRAAKAVTEELAADLADAKEKAKPPTAAAEDHGNKPSRGAIVDEQIQQEEQEMLRNKGKI
ncbi:hypothetical protein FRB90_003431 [Tulasnella sp. 427]|nr:hypothetical protein FRB90_003431 [Tulasnella sp. 427]